MYAKSELAKNIVFDFFVILLAYMNFVYIYLILFLNKRRLLSLITNILAMPTIISLYFTGFSICPFLLLLNLINLNLF